MNETEPRELRLSPSDLGLVCEAMTLYYEKTIRRAHRTREYHSKEQSQQLQTQQKLLQYLMRTRYEWDHPENVRDALSGHGIDCDRRVVGMEIPAGEIPAP
jgi:hypothetical protein